jgi:hypothetical protein
VPVEQISRSIQTLRGQRVILDRELAAIYGAPGLLSREPILGQLVPDSHNFHLPSLVDPRIGPIRGYAPATQDE